MLKLYKDINEVHWIGNSQCTPGLVKFEWNDDRTLLRVPGWSDFQSFDFYLKENSTPYISFAELNTAFASFFLKAGGGAGETILNVTFVELQNLIATSGLTPSEWYLITDFRTSFVLGNTLNVVEHGEIEPIIVRASSTSTLFTEAYSSIYKDDVISFDINLSSIPDDSVYYGGGFEDGVDWGGDFVASNITTNSFDVNQKPSITKGIYIYLEDSINWREFSFADLGKTFFITDNLNGTWTLSFITNIDLTDGVYNYGELYFSGEFGSRTGWITKRHNIFQDITVDADFRTIKSRFGKPDFSGTHGWSNLHWTWDSHDNYPIRSTVYYNNNLYFSKFTNNLNHLPTDPNWWILIENGTADKYISGLNDGSYIPKMGLDTIDMYLFTTEFSKNFLSLSGIRNINLEISDIYTDFYPNNFANNSFENSTLRACRNNIINGDIKNINISYFRYNIKLGSSFENCRISNFQYNYVLGTQKLNGIYDVSEFNYNVVKLGLQFLNTNVFNFNFTNNFFSINSAYAYTSNIFENSFTYSDGKGSLGSNRFKSSVVGLNISRYTYNNDFSNSLSNLNISTDLTSTDFTSATLIYGDQSKEIVETPNGNKYLTFIDNALLLSVNNLTA